MIDKENAENLKDILFCVIIPVFNVEKYIARCIESVLNQTYSNLNLILIDDGSMDSSLDICREYEKRDSRVIVLHQENSGVSAARNAGLDYVFSHDSEKDKYVSFIDSDDWVHKQYLELLYDTLVDSKSDISICSRIRTNADSLVDENLDVKWQTYTPEDFWLKDHSIGLTAWGKLYKASLWQDIRFPVGRIYEDDATTYKVLFKCKQVSFIDQVLYRYYLNTNSLTVSTWTPKRMDRIIAIKEQIAYFEENGMRRAYIKSYERICEDLIKSIRYIEVLMPDDKEMLNSVKRETKKYLKEYGKLTGTKKAFNLWLSTRYINRIKKFIARKRKML